jgi:quinoprotein glucose dehydrogenase
MRARLLSAVILVQAALIAQSNKTPAADWPMFNRDLASTRYSPLTQITTANVAKLAQVWSYRLQASNFRFATAGGAAEVVPIVVNGVMYISTQTRVVALNPETGKEVWSYDVAGGQASPRGVAYWPGDRQNPARIMFTNSRALVALNAATGKLDPGFAKEGILDMVVPYNGVPTIFKNLVLVGASTGEKENGPPGNSRAYDARTGVKLWEFQSIPGPGQVGHESWLSDGWKGRSGANIWGWYMTADEERGILYMPFGAAAANYYGGDRPGANLFGNSVVAVDANTGKYKWHFQVVHHDLWDTDLPAAPSLFDITKDGRRIPAMAVISKNALMFILNRETGEPIHGVVERAVPKGDAPGEWYSPTQPFPVKPPPLARNSFDKDKDLVTAADTTPEHAAACKELFEKGNYVNQGPFTPFPFHEAGAPVKSALQFPGVGAPNWGGTSADPTMGYVFVQTYDSVLSGWIEKKVEGGNYGSGNGSPQPYDRGSVTGPGPYTGFAAMGMPCYKPPWGRLYAINANTGDIAWQVILGINERLPEGKQNVGAVGSAGPTATAGGLVFAPSSDTRFQALDSKTGKQLWQVKMDASMGANPMTYQGKNGKQYVAGVVGGAVVAFALP